MRFSTWKEAFGPHIETQSPKHLANIFPSPARLISGRVFRLRRFWMLHVCTHAWVVTWTQARFARRNSIDRLVDRHVTVKKAKNFDGPWLPLWNVERAWNWFKPGSLSNSHRKTFCWEVDCKNIFGENYLLLIFLHQGLCKGFCVMFVKMKASWFVFNRIICLVSNFSFSIHFILEYILPNLSRLKNSML